MKMMMMMIRPSVRNTITSFRCITTTTTNTTLIKSIYRQQRYQYVNLMQQLSQQQQQQQQHQFSTTTIISHMQATTNPLIKYRINIHNGNLLVDKINTTIGNTFATIPLPFEVSNESDNTTIASTTESTTTTTTTGSGNDGNKTKLPISITLYHYKICPFCTRVRVLLDYLNVPYVAIDVNPLSKNEIKTFKEQYNYNKVPILVIDNEPLFDSNIIITKLLDNTFIQTKLQLRWDDSIIEQNDDEQLIEYEELIVEEENEIAVVGEVSSSDERILASTSVDDTQQQEQQQQEQEIITTTTTTMTMDLFLNTIHKENTDNKNNDTTTTATTKDWSHFATNTVASLLYPNICRTISDSYDAFRYIHQIQKYSLVQQYTIRCIGSIAMYFAASKVKKRLNITDERQALEDALLLFETEGLLTVSNDDNDINLLSGSYYNPNIHDLTMYGVLHSIEGLPIHTELIIKQSHRPITKWYKRMKNIVSKLKTKNTKFIFKINE